MKKKYNILSIEELQELKGGDQNINNKNTFASCNCDYNNAPSATNNINTVQYCTCTCIKPLAQ